MQNTIQALLSSLAEGFSVETDLREHKGTLRISHDIPNDMSPYWDEFLKGVDSQFDPPNSPTLAINIKSDSLVELISKRKILQDHFFFDMSIPESLKFIRSGLPIAQRMSEFESALLPKPGVNSKIWLDSFDKDWFIEADTVLEILYSQPETQVILVSPELHGRDHNLAWAWFRDQFRQGRNLSICTDFPREFEVFVND
jgi:hypothetical protein